MAETGWKPDPVYLSDFGQKEPWNALGVSRNAAASWSAAVLSYYYPQFLSRAWEPERRPLFVILSGVFVAKDPAWQFKSTQRRGVCGGCQRVRPQIRGKSVIFELFGAYREVPSTDSGQALRFEDFAQDDTLLSGDFSSYARFAKMWVMERVLCRLGRRRDRVWRLLQRLPLHWIPTPGPIVADELIGCGRDCSAREGGTGLPHSTTLSRLPWLPPFSHPPTIRTVLGFQPVAHLESLRFHAPSNFTRQAQVFSKSTRLFWTKLLSSASRTVCATHSSFPPVADFHRFAPVDRKVVKNPKQKRVEP